MLYTPNLYNIVHQLYVKKKKKLKIGMREAEAVKTAFHSSTHADLCSCNKCLASLTVYREHAEAAWWAK